MERHPRNKLLEIVVVAQKNGIFVLLNGNIPWRTSTKL